jgi:hypothetical protein
MRDISFYIDTAKEKQGLKSDNELQRAMGYKGSQISFFRSGKSGISDDKMIQLARLGGHDETTALMDLNMWRASTPAVQSAYANILQKLTHATLVFAFATLAIMGSSGETMAFDLLSKVSTDNHNNI